MRPIHSVSAMTLPLARDLGTYQVRVCCIQPGIMETPMMAAATDKVRGHSSAFLSLLSILEY